MWLISKIKYILLPAVVICITTGMEPSNNWSPVLTAKIEKAFIVLYETEQLKFESVVLSDAIESSTPADLKNHLFKVYANGTFTGYAYVAQAPSMKNVFDYLVVFNKELSIEKAKILIYREQHGRQIGTTRWLNQFQGMTTVDRPVLGQQVDGISGATISAKGMTTAINNLLTSLSIVKEKGAI